MNALQIAYSNAKAAWNEAQNEYDKFPLPADDELLTDEDWAGIDFACEALANRLQMPAKWAALQVVEEALLTWGKATSIRLAKTDEEKAAIEAVFNSATGRKMVIDSLLRLEA